MEKGQFSNSRNDELKELILARTVQSVDDTSITGMPRIFGSRFVDEIKRVGSALKRNSRLVAQNYFYEDKTLIASKGPTVQRFSQLIYLFLASSLSRTQCKTRNVTKLMRSITHPSGARRIHLTTQGDEPQPRTRA